MPPYIGLATKWLRILSLGGIDKVRNHLVAKPIIQYRENECRSGYKDASKEKKGTLANERIWILAVKKLLWPYCVHYITPFVIFINSRTKRVHRFSSILISINWSTIEWNERNWLPLFLQQKFFNRCLEIRLNRYDEDRGGEEMEGWSSRRKRRSIGNEREQFSRSSRLIFPSVRARAWNSASRARTCHGPMTSIHFHARMEIVVLERETRERERERERVCVCVKKSVEARSWRGQRYSAAIGEHRKRVFFTSASKITEQRPDEKRTDRIKNSMLPKNVHVVPRSRTLLLRSALLRDIDASCFVSRNELRYKENCK